MNRNAMLQQLAETVTWDMVIVGGGATGLGTAIDAATRGYKVLLAERFDFGKGTSSRSTKLIHGGVRYLAQGNFKLVTEALRERGMLLKNAPHITSIQSFIVPVFSIWEKIYYTAGLALYDLLAGKLSVGKSKTLSKKQVLDKIPSLQPEKLFGGIRYFDGQFDDARLCVDLAFTAAAHGACVLNYCNVIAFEKNKGIIDNVVLEDTISRKKHSVRCKTVINATGVFAGTIAKMDDADTNELIMPSQGIHLVVDRKFFPEQDALMIPKTEDGRVLFAVPWHNKVVIGTTDTPVAGIIEEPKALEDEVDFLIHHFNKYNARAIQKKDVLSVFAGLRPLIRSSPGKSTSLLSRDHTIIVTKSRLVTVTGGKWTTYRKMAEEAVNNAAFVAQLPKKKCITSNLPIQYYSVKSEGLYAAEKIHPEYLYTCSEVIDHIRKGMALTVEDILARRMRLLFLDAKAAMEAAPVVALLLQKERVQTDEWREEQIISFQTLARQYLLS